jgi:CubicO group peptidase (beta-lactamase class C family)
MRKKRLQGWTIIATFSCLLFLTLAISFFVRLRLEPNDLDGWKRPFIQSRIETILRGSDGAPAISVAIVEHDATVYADAFGLAKVRTATHATSETRFFAGSISKMFVAVAMIQLAESGKLALDRPVSQYVAGIPHGAAITLRELLSNTSGLPNVLDEAISDGSAFKMTTPATIIARAGKRSLDFAPGTKFEYSNTNFVVLGLVVEAVSQMPLAEYEKRRILDPCAMRASSFNRPGEVGSHASGYSDAAGSVEVPLIDPSWLYAAGDLVTTATDLARFDINLMQGKLISKAALNMLEADGRPMGEGSRYTLGFIVTPVGTLTALGHHGGMPGFEADDEMFISDGFAIIVLGNASTFATSAVNSTVLSTLYPINFALTIVQHLLGSPHT